MWRVVLTAGRVFNTEENLTRVAEQCEARSPDDENLNTVEKSRAFGRREYPAG